ncbi:class I adenylate-forming enzyme family protein [Marinicellulosiphila megalodicopiae]|uniref:class I adenylate-forming enzyme family protein n=1 Tax=Marinicellulosiphila megalodicopiae TaxID=2724896 RepID=UPI003BB0A815
MPFSPNSPFSNLATQQDCLLQYEHLSLVDIIDLLDEEFSDYPAFCDIKGHNVYYNEIVRDARSVAKYLTSVGLNIGDKVVLRMTNRADYAVACYGVILAGGVVVNINPMLHPKQYQWYLKQAQASFIITETSNELRILSQDELNIAFYTAIARGEKLKTRLPTLSPHHLAIMQFTNTPSPSSKPILLTHQNVLVNAMQIREMLDTHIQISRETWLCPLPLYHHFNFMCVMWTIPLTGGKTILASPRDGEGFWQCLEDEMITAILGIEPFFAMMLHHPDITKLYWDRLKFSITGAMQLNKNTIEKWKEITGSEIFEFYTLSEASAVIASNKNNDQINILELAPETQHQIIDRKGYEVSVGSTGQLCIKGPQIMHGYSSNRHEYPFNSTGFFKTGDIVKRHPNNKIEFIKKQTDSIFIQGHEYFPEEIAQLVKRLPGIDHVQVKPQLHHQNIDLVIATQNQSMDKNTILQWLEKNKSLENDYIGNVQIIDTSDHQPPPTPDISDRI